MKENSSRFYSWGLQRTVVKKVCSIAFFLAFSFFFVTIKRLVHPPLLGDDGSVVIVVLLILSYQSNWWQAVYDMGWGVLDLVKPVWKPALNCQNLVTWFPYIACPWCNGYRRRKWTRWHEFKSWTDCISHRTNTLGKRMNPIILPPAMGKS